MKLQSERKITLTIGEDEATFILRNPTNKELNEFLADRYEIGRKGKMRDNSLQARVELFDALLIRIENLEDSGGNPIGVDRKEIIPPNWKASVIFQAFEDVEVSEKN